MIQKFFIPERFPGMNEIIDAASHRTLRRSKAIGGKINRYANMKAAYTQLVKAHAIVNKIQKAKGSVTLHYLFIEPDRRRDKSNISASMKFIEDGLVLAGIIPNDTWRYIDHIMLAWKVDKERPGVMIMIEERG